jgi:hypothetical protein
MRDRGVQPIDGKASGPAEGGEQDGDSEDGGICAVFFADLTKKHCGI